MIGNDVVDLGDADSRSAARHPRVDARIFGDGERWLLGRASDADLMRSMLWAAKESAFKLLKRSMPGLVFAPSRFVVELRGDRAAIVDTAGIRVPVDFELAGSFVHAIAREPQIERARICSGVARLDSMRADPSASVRRLTVATIARELGEDPSMLKVGRDGRLPLLLRDGARVGGTLSLSHHGRFVAFAWSRRESRLLLRRVMDVGGAERRDSSAARQPRDITIAAT